MEIFHPWSGQLVILRNIIVQSPPFGVANQPFGYHNLPRKVAKQLMIFAQGQMRFHNISSYFSSFTRVPYYKMQLWWLATWIVWVTCHMKNSNVGVGFLLPLGVSGWENFDSFHGSSFLRRSPPVVLELGKTIINLQGEHGGYKAHVMYFLCSNFGWNHTRHYHPPCRGFFYNMPYF